MTNKDVRALIEEARRLENDYGDNYEVMTVMSELADVLEASAVSSPSGSVEDVLREHRIVGVSGYGIEEVMCACQHNGWTGGGKWHPASWHPKHVAKKLAKLSAVSTPPTITAAQRESIAFALFVHESGQDESFLRRVWGNHPDEHPVKLNYYGLADAALAAALHPGGETNG